jgi:hypothetical protein
VRALVLAVEAPLDLLTVLLLAFALLDRRDRRNHRGRAEGTQPGRDLDQAD